jgi:hypothetical protein
MRYVKGFKPSGSMVVAIIALVVATAGTAVAAATISGSSLTNNSVASKKIKNKTLKVKDFTPKTKTKLKGATGDTGATGADGAAGADGAQGPTGPATPAEYTNPQWGQIDRNTIGSPSVVLRGGPYVGAEVPPFGVGSLSLNVDGPGGSAGAAAEQATFGNEADFVGDLVADINEVGFHVYTTGENNDTASPNMPSIKIELDPNLNATASNFSTAVFVPDNSVSNEWSGYINAADGSDGFWFLTGAAGAATGCNQATTCTFAQLKAALAADAASDATVYTVAVGKGRDNAWAGSIDGLRVNAIVYDFEPFGVEETTAP